MIRIFAKQWSAEIARFAYKPREKTTPNVKDSSSPPTQYSSPTPVKVTGTRKYPPFKPPLKAPERAAPRQTPLAAFQATLLEKPRPVQAGENQYELQHVAAKAKLPAPIIQGIPLVPVHRLPDRFRSVFSHPLFNAVQSRCFDSVYESSDNLVVSAPTGSGKTAILELAICALYRDLQQGTYKVVYQAPTKSLCSERKKGKNAHGQQRCW
jgi:ATP-dependent DNA helicase HFM1/MER3